MSASSSPPSYYSPTLGGYPQPTSAHPSPPHFRQRKSATIISISSSSSTGSMSSDDEVTPINHGASSSALPRDMKHNGARSPVNQPIEEERSESAVAPLRKEGIPSHVRELSLDQRSSNGSGLAEEGEAETSETTTLLGKGEKPKWYRQPLVEAGIKFSVLFLIFTAVVVGTFWFCLPVIADEDKKVLKLPRSFDDLLALNDLFQKYKSENPLRIMACGVVAYLFVQMFTLPGSMYISILFGAAYGMVQGLLLSCFCDATGSALCYTLSALLGPPLLSMPFYRARVETWRVKIMGDPTKGKQASWFDIFAFLLVLRITPFPPHWIPNFVAPHLGIHIGLFWLSCFIGIAPVSVIHVTIGSSLDTMTSAADFHILSVRNVLGMIAVVVAILIPVGLKRIFKKDLEDLGEAEQVLEEQPIDATQVDVPPVEGVTRRYQAVDSGVVLAGPSQGDPSFDLPSTRNKGKGRAVEIITDIQEEDEEERSSLSGSPRPAKPYEMPHVDQKRRLRSFKGYGAIEPEPVPGYRDTSSPTWAFTR